MGSEMTPENIALNWDEISDMEGAQALNSGPEQSLKIFELLNKSE